ncbi:MAG: exodeoxyribonuclease VII small subunit [Candidatus Wallbacteria bacterium]|nr:exodeoxyribonuclease VII small subunit [Candidatus Wallbacteria bacterium]
MSEERKLKFSEGLKRLEEIVDKMEKEEYEIEEMIETFQEGIKLYKSLQQKLKEVELKVNQVLEREGEIVIEEK